MNKGKEDSNRREFLSRLGVAAAMTEMLPEPAAASDTQTAGDLPKFQVEDLTSSIDFRYAPALQQMTTCFPDDTYKSLVGQNGELRLGHKGMGANLNDFRTVAEFSVLGMEPDIVRSQRIEAPGIPIVHTRIDRPDAYMEITVFSSREPDEGRVDNVLVEIRPRTKKEVAVVPLIILRTRANVWVAASPTGSVVSTQGEKPEIIFIGDTKVSQGPSSVTGDVLTLRHGIAREDHPLQYFLRFPQEGQTLEKLQAKLRDPQQLVENVRLFWNEWKPYGGNVGWRYPSRYDQFLTACTRNILQAREVKHGQLTFQVGPTVYRGLFVVDGNFILEAARYLGYDREAQLGLETTWALQEKSGGIFAGAGREHWKDTGIALFSLVRQAELAQDYSYLREMQPNALRAIAFLRELREHARQGYSVNGRYGLLPPGFADGGLAGQLSEFTNTLWVLAGLKAYLATASRLNLQGLDEARIFHNDLRKSFISASQQEMKEYSTGFKYLPMAAKEDPIWHAPDKWDRPRPQSAQWALSQAIFPGLVFEPNDPIVQGHIRLMQAVTQEDVPAETGWLSHGGLWTYNAPFVSEVYLWAGLPDWARLTFHGFLNHATPTYCWREEQPLQGSLTAAYVGDMPHNWASAECIRYLRHSLILEDAMNLRLLAGIADPELAGSEPMELQNTPTRFGRINLLIEPLDRNAGWRLKYRRPSGPPPVKLIVPLKLGRQFQYSTITGAGSRQDGNRVLIDAQARSWEAIWRV